MQDLHHAPSTTRSRLAGQHRPPGGYPGSVSTTLFGEGLATNARGTSMDVDNAKKLIATGASVTFLPPFADQRAHYTLAPVASMRPFLRDLLRPWSDNQIAVGAATPHAWQFLFFHEYPVFGGDLDSSATPATLRPFFLQALGTPQPLTTPPTTIPP
jgi:hypothetical protein